MWLKAVPSIVECSSHHVFFQHPSLLPSPSSLSSRNDLLFLPSSNNPFASQTPIPTSRRRAIRPSSCSNTDGNLYRDDASFNVEQLAKQSSGRQEDQGHIFNTKRHRAVSKHSPFHTDHKHTRDRDSFLHSRFDFLEPMMLGIKPEFPGWPDRDSVVIEQKAKSFDIPLSLRMIKKKLQLEDGSRDSSNDAIYCSVKAAFSSMVFIIVELQSHALHMREALCHEDLDVISSKVQKEMHSSFVWLFQQVFSKTPALMLHVMILLADFSVYSTSNNIIPEKLSQYCPPQIEEKMQGGNSIKRSQKLSSYLGDHQWVNNAAEMSLWNSMVDDATNMREGGVEEEMVLDHDTVKYFVSPVSVEIQPDGYEDFLRTDLLYQMNLSHEPDHPLLLCNYAQFLHLVAHDHDRAEECFKRAVQVLPPDAECLSQYANFLWTVRSDFTGAEEMFLEALAIEPDNSYYASRYANFLWSTGGEETCFPLNNSQNSNT